MKINRKVVFILSLLSLIGFSIVGFVIIYFLQGIHPIQLFAEGETITTQLIYGSIFGLLAAVNATIFILSPWMYSTREFFTRLIGKINPSFAEVIFYSFCAAVGEEIFFRGAIQPYLGIWLTSFLFILLHGYINPKNWQLTIYGIFMILISAGLGYLFDRVGLIAAMAGHFVYDVMIFILLLRWARKEKKQRLTSTSD